MKQSLPFAFTENMKRLLGDRIDAFLEAMDQAAPVSVRVNPHKPVTLFNNHEQVVWATGGFYLPERISFTLDPLFHAGCYYVQEASSMYLESALKAVADLGKPLRILDLSAAPGGKSTHLLSMISENSLLVSNEIIPSRNNILQQNLTKWGVCNVVVTQNRPSDFGSRLPGFFDVVLVDAPCSGEGLFRKDSDAISEWSVENVAHCAHRQSEILEDVLPTLKNGGILIYSTCTYEASENEDQIARLADRHKMDLLAIPGFPGMEKTTAGFRFYPHQIKGEGFFISVLRKNNGDEDFSSRKEKIKGVNHSHQKYLNDFLDAPEKFLPFAKDETLYALPEFHQHDLFLLMKLFYVRQAGIAMGKIVREKLLPDHALAVNCHLKDIPVYDTADKESALRYLRGEPLPVDGNGWQLVRYNNHALGWMKALGGRSNNYYPTALRIKMQI